MPATDTNDLPSGLPAFLSVPRVAEILDISEKTVLRRIEDKALRAIRTGTVRGRLRIPRQALAEFLEASRV